MEFELYNCLTGEIFKKTIISMHKAQQFIENCKYSRKIMILSKRYL